MSSDTRIHHYAEGERALIQVETPRCTVCGETTTFVLEATKFESWQSGTLIQTVWPGMSADDRETLINGTHGPCFDKLFPPEPDEPDHWDEG